jgi:hypothetical protein
MIKKHLEGISYAAELPSVASDLIENRVFGFGVRRLTQLDVNATKLRSLQIEGPRVDRLPELIGR